MTTEDPGRQSSDDRSIGYSRDIEVLGCREEIQSDPKRELLKKVAVDKATTTYY